VGLVAVAPHPAGCRPRSSLLVLEQVQCELSSQTAGLFGNVSLGAETTREHAAVRILEPYQHPGSAGPLDGSRARYSRHGLLESSRARVNVCRVRRFVPPWCARGEQPYGHHYDATTAHQLIRRDDFRDMRTRSTTLNGKFSEAISQACSTCTAHRLPLHLHTRSDSYRKLYRRAVILFAPKI
jgi:hypothetical protein